MTNWHLKKTQEIFNELRSSECGLSAVEVEKRLKEYGPNKLSEAKVDGLVKIFFRQFQNPLIYLLLIAAGAVIFMGGVTDAIIIFVVLLMNAIIGSIQEGKAQNTLLALKNFVETKATVYREDKEEVILDSEIVVGDIILLREGDKIPADSRLIFVNNLKVDEASLTGESEPALKSVDTNEKQNAMPAEQKNMVFKGTHVVAGIGRAIVVATGVNTEIGKISQKLIGIETEIPLKKEIRKLSKSIIIATVVISAGLFFIGIILGKTVTEMFATIVTLAVSVIPEGLPVVTAIVLATGVWRMAKRNVLVKKLQAVEALGQARVIIVDKTGTITKNEMAAQKIYLPAGKAGVMGKMFEIGGNGYEPIGEIKVDGQVIEVLEHPELLFAGKVVAYCANASAVFDEESKQWRAQGDPTEAALRVFAQKLGFHKETLEKDHPMIAEEPFDYKKKYHATARKIGRKIFVTVVGAPEEVLKLSAFVMIAQNETHHLNEERRAEFERVFHAMSQEGLRSLGVAVAEFDEDNFSIDKLEKLSFVGLIGIRDVLRPEAKEAVAKCIDANIRVVMATGDHKITAQAIAKEAGIWHEGDEILTGEEIEKMSMRELVAILPRVSVFSRVTPEHKLKIVRAFKDRKEIVAMTGDGVNDAMSLVAADLGVAMGKIGTEVAKEAADIILLDDNFGSIVSAVEEGRNIYRTIKRVILYLFSTSLGEALTVTVAVLIGFPLPLLPSHLIWLNFVTDSFLDVSLAMEPKGKTLLKGEFGRRQKSLFDGFAFRRMVIMAIPMAIGSLWIFQNYYGAGLDKARTMTLTVLAVFQWFNAWNCRYEKKTLFAPGFFANKFLIGAMFIVGSLQVAAIYAPFMQKIMHTVPLVLNDWLLVIAVATSVVVVEEARKWWQRKGIR